MNKQNSKICFLVCNLTVFVIGTVVFWILYSIYDQFWMAVLRTTFLTTSYHFLMRLMVGEIVTLACKNKVLNPNSWYFRTYNWETKLYNFIKVGRWKNWVITAKPAQFKFDKNNLGFLLHNMLQAEMVHRIIMWLSFVPLLLIIPFGEPLVFILTSIFACLVDFKYVIVQRYNRPRLVKIMKMMK